MAIFVLFVEGCNAVIFLIFAQCIPSLLPPYFLGVAGNVTDRTDRDYHLLDILSPLKEVRFLDTNVAATPS